MKEYLALSIDTIELLIRFICNAPDVYDFLTYHQDRLCSELHNLQMKTDKDPYFLDLQRVMQKELQDSGSIVTLLQNIDEKELRAALEKIK